MTQTTIANQREDRNIFADHCVYMRSIYQHFKILFEDSTADEKELMSRTANVFFSDLHRTFIEYLILQVCKITDPAEDLRGNDNLTIAFLLRHYDFSGEPTTLRRLIELAEKMQAFRAKLLPARNKLISHSDRDTIMANRALGSASEGEWNEFWLNLQDLVYVIHEKIVGEPFWINGVAMLSAAQGLLRALTHSRQF